MTEQTQPQQPNKETCHLKDTCLEYSPEEGCRDSFYLCPTYREARIKERQRKEQEEYDARFYQHYDIGLTRFRQ